MKTINVQLMRAVQENDTTQVKVFLQYHKANLDLESCNSKDGKTLLHECCRTGNLDIIRLLVDNGAKLEAVDVTGNTPLHFACEAGHMHVTKFLILNCANVYTKNDAGLLAVDLAKEKSLKLLLDMAMSVKSTNVAHSMTLDRPKRRRSQNSRYQTNTNNNVEGLNKKDLENSTAELSDKKQAINKKLEKSSYKAQKSFSFNKDRRNTWTGKLKTIDSFKKDSSKRNKVRLRLLKHRQENELRRVSSETDIETLASSGMEIEEKSRIQKVQNTDQINLIGLTIQ